MNIIEIKDLTKKFNGLTAVDNISLAIKQGEIFAFLGPNGAGKTTTIKMLTTLLKPTSGSMLLDGNDPVKDQNKVRRSFGIVFQDQSLDDDLTAYENMEFHAFLYNVPRKERKPRIKMLLEFVELWDRKKDQVKKYSGGMKRRLEIARGFLHRPKILFLDEPTLGLDPQTRNKIWEYVKKANKEENTTVFFTTHYMEEAEKVADRVAIIDHGKIITDESPQKIKDDTQTKTLEEAFLSLTGHEMRNEEASQVDQLRMHRQMHRER